MPNNQVFSIEIKFTLEFKRNLRALSRKYRHIRSDVQPVIDQLKSGEIVGDRIFLLNGYDRYYRIMIKGDQFK